MCTWTARAPGSRPTRALSRWRAGEALSRIDGAPISIKDNVAVKGWAWRGGVGAYAKTLAEADAPVVARLRAAGAVILGQTNMHEGAFGAVTDNPWTGRTHNPWDYERTAGGSSGGAGAAVAAGLCAAALGTDTLGSVRIPASFCGVFGHKPETGLIPTDGVMPMAWSLDTVGAIARSADDAALLFAAMAASDPDFIDDLAEPARAEALRTNLAEAPLGVLEIDGLDLSAEAARALEVAAATARMAGLPVESVRLPGFDWAGAYAAAAFVSAADSAAFHAEALARDPDGFSDAYKAILGMATRRTAADLAAAIRTLRLAGEAIREGLSAYPAVLLPTTPERAFTFESGRPMSVGALTFLANTAGLPATAFPVGLDDVGLPRSVSVMGWDDDTTLGLARLLADPPGAPPAYRG